MVIIKGVAMAFDFRDFDSEYLDESFIEWLVDEQWVEIGSHFGRLWDLGLLQVNLYTF